MKVFLQVLERSPLFFWELMVLSYQATARGVLNVVRPRPALTVLNQQ